MVDKNLFLYDLAIVTIFKDEGHYLKEWIDYHLLAGVEHFYLYNNDSTDNYKEVLAPYIEQNLVTLTDFPGKAMQMPAYNDAIDKYRFDCRFMALIDLDEFIYVKNRGGGISELVDEILFDVPNAAGLAINWQIFGSNGQDKADYSRGVLERFTRRAPSDWVNPNSPIGMGNNCAKTIDNPRLIRYRLCPHGSDYFDGKVSVFSNGDYHHSILADKIVINHYYVKSKEEFLLKQKRGRAAGVNLYLPTEFFHQNDRNEIFDDGILKYRTARAEKFSFESYEQRISRVINSLVKILTQPEVSLNDKLEIFLTCRDLAEKFQIKICDDFAEEYALAWICRTLPELTTYAEIQMFLKELPKILARPFPVCKQIYDFAQSNILPRLCETLKNGTIGKKARTIGKRDPTGSMYNSC